MPLDTNITKNPNRLAETRRICRECTWEKRGKCFQMLDNVYCIGTTFASQYLVNTSAGLVMLDAGWNQMAPFTIDAIHRLGFDPCDIKYLLLTHGHFDHVGGARIIQEFSHCKTMAPQGDAFFFTERRDLMGLEDTCPEFTIDEYYDYSKKYMIGDTEFWFVHCPGHTPGTTSIFFKTMHRGKELVCALHGGFGLQGLAREQLIKKKLPTTLQQEYVDSMDMVEKMHVDVFVPAHQFGYDILEISEHDDGTGNVFIDDTVWPRLMRETKEKFLENYGQELGLPPVYPE